MNALDRLESKVEFKASHFDCATFTLKDEATLSNEAWSGTISYRTISLYPIKVGGGYPHQQNRDDKMLRYEC